MVTPVLVLILPTRDMTVCHVAQVACLPVYTLVPYNIQQRKSTSTHTAEAFGFSQTLFGCITALLSVGGHSNVLNI